MGPKAREILAAVTDADISNNAFPFGHARIIDIAGHQVRALRVTYVGELGWELHMPIGAAGEVFDALMLAGAPLGMRPTGYRALEALRLEKGYRAWGSDITANDDPFQAGLGWAVKLKSDQAFLGREACEKVANSALAQEARRLHHARSRSRAARPRDDPAQRRVCRLSDQRRLWLHDRQADRLRLCPQWPAASTTTISASGAYELVVAKEIVPARVHLEALYDPKNEKVKA